MEITISEFHSLLDRLESAEKRLDALNSHACSKEYVREYADERVAQLGATINAHAVKIDKVSGRAASLEGSVKALQPCVKRSIERLKDLEERMKDVEGVAAASQAGISRVWGHFSDTIEPNQARHEKKIFELEERISNYDTILGRHINKIEELKESSDAHRKAINTQASKKWGLEERFESLEKTTKECDLKIADTIVAMLDGAGKHTEKILALEIGQRDLFFRVESLKTSEMDACKRLSELESAQSGTSAVVQSQINNSHLTRIKELEKKSKIPVTTGLTNEAPHGKYQKLVEACKELLNSTALSQTTYIRPLERALEELGVG